MSHYCYLCHLFQTVTDIQGSVKDNVIQCGFNVPSMKTTIFDILLGNGSVGTHMSKLTHITEIIYNITGFLNNIYTASHIKELIIKEFISVFGFCQDRITPEGYIL